MIKFNSDAQFKLGSGLGFSGIVGRNYMGKLVARCTSRFYAPSPLVAEALAFREAILFASSMGIPSILLESDCPDLVDACR